MRAEKAEADVLFGLRLKRVRDDAGLTTIQLSERLFLTRESVDRYMRGERRPSKDLVERWEELCGLPSGSLVADYNRLPPRGTSSDALALNGAPDVAARAEPTTDPAGVASEAAPVPSETAPVDTAHLPSPESPQPTIDRPRPDEILTPGPAHSAIEQPERDKIPTHARTLLLAAVAATVIAGAAGWFVGHALSAPTPPDRQESSASNSDVELRVPATWSRTTSDIAPPGLELSDPIVIAANQPSGAGIIVGISRATGQTLLTAGTLRRLDRLPGQDVGEQVGALDAYRYANLRIRDFAGRVSLYVAPTSIGVLTLACFSSGSDVQRFRSSCRAVAQSLKLRHGTSYPLGPSVGYQHSLNDALSPLNVMRRRHRATLKAAGTHQSQAAFAQRLRRTFAEARARAARLRVSPRESAVHRQILRELETTADAYGRLASAARRASPPDYRRAATAVVRAEARLRIAIRGLRQLGYP